MSGKCGHQTLPSTHLQPLSPYVLDAVPGTHAHFHLAVHHQTNQIAEAVPQKQLLNNGEMSSCEVCKQHHFLGWRGERGGGEGEGNREKVREERGGGVGSGSGGEVGRERGKER